MDYYNKIKLLLESKTSAAFRELEKAVRAQHRRELGTEVHPQVLRHFNKHIGGVIRGKIKDDKSKNKTRAKAINVRGAAIRLKRLGKNTPEDKEYAQEVLDRPQFRHIPEPSTTASRVGGMNRVFRGIAKDLNTDKINLFRPKDGQ